MAQVGGSASSPEGYQAVRFYDGNRALGGIVAEFLHDGFEDANPGIVIATEGLRTAIDRSLAQRGLDVVALQRSHNLLLVDAEETLATFMMDGRPDASKFDDQIRQTIGRACGDRANCTVRIFGEMVNVLWHAGQHDAAIRLEVLWNQLAHARASSLLCAYAMGNFYKEANRDDICRQPLHIVSAGGTDQIT
jgi:hypothetical protein